MCVIILVEEHRPTKRFLEAAAKTNGDGGGVGWREPSEDGNGNDVLWAKGLKVDEIYELSKTLPLPFVIHFRATSVGGDWPDLTHPFEVSEDARVETEFGTLRGRGKFPILFHNGTWHQWQDKTLEAAIRSGVPLPEGRWSDTRALAWMSAVCGKGIMNFVSGQKGIIFDAVGWNIFSGDGWEKVKETCSCHNQEQIFWCSNDRPWKSGYYNHQYHNQNHSSQANSSGFGVCQYGTCRSKNVDGHGYCPDHTGGREKQEATQAVHLPGGAGNVTPFPRPQDQGETTGEMAPLTLRLADELFKNKKISKNMLKGITKNFERMRSKDPKETERGLQNLRDIQHAMQLGGVAQVA